MVNGNQAQAPDSPSCLPLRVMGIALAQGVPLEAAISHPQPRGLSDTIETNTEVQCRSACRGPRPRSIFEMQRSLHFSAFILAFVTYVDASWPMFRGACLFTKPVYFAPQPSFRFTRPSRVVVCIPFRQADKTLGFSSRRVSLELDPA